MPDPQDALNRFRSAAASAVERGRRIAGDAAASGAAFQRESDEQVRRLQRGEGPDPDARERDLRPTAADLRAASAEYRTERGLPVPELPEATGTAEAPAARPRRRTPPPDEDFSDFRIMGPV